MSDSPYGFLCTMDLAFSVPATIPARHSPEKRRPRYMRGLASSPRSAGPGVRASFGVTAREEKPAPAGAVRQVRQVEGKSDEPQKPGKTRATRPSRRTWLIVNARQGEFTLFSACP